MGGLDEMEGYLKNIRRPPNSLVKKNFDISSLSNAKEILREL
jgi:hypothetical protein